MRSVFSESHTRPEADRHEFLATPDAVETFAKKASELLAQAGAHQALSSSLAYDAGR